MATPNSVEDEKLPASANDVKPASSTVGAPAALPGKSGTCSSCSCANGGASSVRQSAFVYAIGRIEPRFPRISVEKELAQAAGLTETAGLTDRQLQHKVLSDPRHRYIARQYCWVMTISGVDKYFVTPRQLSDVDVLVATLRPVPDP